MKKSIISLIVLLSILLIPGVLAQNSQGLTWSVIEGQEIYYEVTKSGSCYPLFSDPVFLDESFIAKVTLEYLEDIPPTLTNWTEIPYAIGSLVFENGSTASIISGVSFAMPIGNWILLQEIHNDSKIHLWDGYKFMNATYFDNSSFWGFMYSYNAYVNIDLIPGGPTPTMNCTITNTMLYAKADGVLASSQLTLQYYNGLLDAGTVVQTLNRIEGFFVFPTTFVIIVVVIIAIPMMIILCAKFANIPTHTE